MPDVEMGRGVEFDLIRKLQAGWGSLAVGLGDDAAILELPRGDRLVATTDSAIERVHFRLDWLTPQQIGYRAATAAISDLAAMAARPLGILVAIALPDESISLLPGLGEGIGMAAADAGTVIVGGNLSRAGIISITTTALGSSFSPLTRAGARPGDFIYLTGRLGGPTAALRSLRAGATPEPAIMERFTRPAARIAEARWLADRGAVAAVDVSDGLMADAGHLAAASRCDLDLDMERVPLMPGVEREDAFGGEEYELLVASRTPFPVEEFTRELGTALTLIGRAAEGEGAVKLNHALPLAGAGWVHFEG